MGCAHRARVYTVEPHSYVPQCAATLKLPASRCAEAVALPDEVQANPPVVAILVLRKVFVPSLKSLVGLGVLTAYRVGITDFHDSNKYHYNKAVLSIKKMEFQKIFTRNFLEASCKLNNNKKSYPSLLVWLQE